MGRPKKIREKGDDGKSHRIWEFTDHKVFDEDGNPVPERMAKWERMAKPDMCKKLMLAREQCPTTGKWHAQGRQSFPVAHSFEYVRKLYGCHCEVTVASDDWSYFNKLDESIIIDVDFRRQGQRNVFKDQLGMIKEGATMSECIHLDGANAQSVRSAEILMEYLEKPRPVGPIEVIYGLTLAEVHQASPAVYTPPPGPLYNWSGYDGHTAVCIDCSLHEVSVLFLLTLTGSLPFRVHTKRGCRQARYTRIYVLNPPDGYRRISLGYRGTDLA